MPTDGVTKRHPLDQFSNSQGDKLLTFINGIRGCILNGRIMPERDDFTLITSYRGRAVVDYFIVRQSDLQSITKFEVLNCVTLVTEIRWESLVSDVSQVPDHSLISTKIESSSVVLENLVSDRNLRYKSVQRQKVHRKPGESYMNGETALRLLPILLDEIEECSVNQDGINLCYTNLTNFIFDEVELSLQGKNKK